MVEDQESTNSNHRPDVQLSGILRVLPEAENGNFQSNSNEN